MGEEPRLERVTQLARSVQAACPGAVFIGGVAVAARLAETPGHADLAGETHDADLMLSGADLAGLIETPTSNRRLRKREFVREGIAFDVYVQGEHRLIVPYEDAYPASTLLPCGLRVASAEHLLLLKAEAFSDRQGTAPGEKDAQDIVRVLLAAGDLSCTPSIYWSAESVADVRVAVRSGAVGLAAGNAWHAARLRRAAEAAFGPLAKAVAERDPGPDA